MLQQHYRLSFSKRASASRLHGEPARNMNAVQLDTLEAGAKTCRWRWSTLCQGLRWNRSQ